MAYSVKEMFKTLQGEGAQAGRAAVFCRFAGCNLWTGREEHRAEAQCRFCDTDFVGTDGEGGGRFADAAELARAIAAAWDGDRARRFVVFTGGEPLLQLDAELIAAVHAEGFDWICVSPKAGTALAQRRGQELKLVFPQPDLMPEAAEELDFAHFFLQPMDGPERAAHTQAAVAYCLGHPRWRLSLQTHKMIGIP
jgi:7-carboxy-7-deazaguanine synthase (Cx14CxxC type)